jgi:hypothetical protein
MLSKCSSVGAIPTILRILKWKFPHQLNIKKDLFPHNDDMLLYFKTVIPEY